MRARPPSRAPTTFAVGFLLLDAALFALAGIAFDRPILIVAALAFAGGAVVVILAWRRYRRTIAELEDARREMKREVEEIRELLQRQNLEN